MLIRDGKKKLCSGELEKRKFEFGKGGGDTHGPILPYSLTDVEFQSLGTVTLRTFP